jgi:hypothetical protein
MEKITKKILLEEIEEIVRINELIRFGSKSNVNEQVISFFEKLIRGGEEGISDVVKTIERSGIKGADDVASAFRGLAEKGFKALSQEESLFLSNVIRQVFPDISSQVSRDLSSLMTPYLGQVGVGKLEGILANERFSTEQIYRRLTTDFGMENLSMLELQVWRDALKGKPIDVRIPTTVEVKPKPENITQPIELKLTPAEESLLNQSVEDTVNRMESVPPIEVNSLEEANSEFNRLLSTINDPKITDEIKRQLIETYNKQISSKETNQLNNNTNRFFDYLIELQKVKGPQFAEQVLDSQTKNLPKHQRGLLKRIWDRVNTKDPFERRIIVISSVAMSIGQLLYTWIDMRQQGDKYKGLFGLSGKTLLLVKGGLLLFSGFFGTGVYFIANTVLAAIDVIIATYHSILKDFQPKDPNEPNLVDDVENLVGGKFFYITIEEAEKYAENEPVNPGFETLEDSDILTYKLLDKDSKVIETTNKKQQGRFVQVLKNNEPFVVLKKQEGGKIKPL